MENQNNKQHAGLKRSHVIIILIVVLLVAVSSIIYFTNSKEVIKPAEVQRDVRDEIFADGIHQPTGLKEGEGLITVIAHCTACHSADLIIQNRMDKDGWNTTIKWMQETQNLWDLGANQEVIVNYLVKNYPVTHKGRRGRLEDIDWYELTD